jgi:hypothetical protein
MAPPYAFAPRDAPWLDAREWQLEQVEPMTCTDILVAEVLPAMLLLLLLEAALLQLQT